MKPSEAQEAINWFPGHMHKARQELQARLKQVDVVLEIRDARLPEMSVNPEFETLLQQKKRLILFNKSGLADPQITQAWQAYFRGQIPARWFIDVQQNKGLPQILPKARELMQEKWQTFRKKGIRPPALRLMIVGVPNIGKSSLINRLVKRHATATGPMPGVTKQQSWVSLSADVELLDTPGLLWPRLEPPEVGLCLAVTGAIKDQIVGEEKLGIFLLEHYLRDHPERIPQYYGLSLAESNPMLLLEAIGRQRGCLKQQGLVDTFRAAKLLLADFRAGKLGPTSFERPPFLASKDAPELSVQESLELE